MADATLDMPLPGSADFHRNGEELPAAFGGMLDDFVVGPENRLVELIIGTVLAGRANDYNPIFLCGPSGTGKSHLVQGLATAWKHRYRRSRVQNMTIVDFARELADAIESQGEDEFRTKYRQADFAVFEDVGELGQKRSEKLSAQQELVCTLDALVDRGSWVIVTGAKTPAELHDIIPALQSRLAAGLTVPLAPPGVETRIAIVERAANERQLRLPRSAIETLAEGISGTVPELLGALTQLEIKARSNGKAIDFRMIRPFLAERTSGRGPDIPQIAAGVAKHYGQKLSDLRSTTRRRAVVQARDVAIHLARKLTHASLDQIGSYFGGRDHTTMMHSCRKIEELLCVASALREEIEQLEKDL
jgi:chromosomal replication initiator protein